MKKIVVTNNKKVADAYSKKVEVVMLNGATSLEVLMEGEKIASGGGRLMLDPTRNKGFYKSLIFLKEEDCNSPDEKSISLLEQSIKQVGEQEKGTGTKEPLFAGILQNKDLGLVKGVLY